MLPHSHPAQAPASMSGSDRSQRPRLLLGGDNNAPRAMPRSSSSTPPAAVINDTKRAIASRLRTPNTTPKAPTADRTDGIAPSIPRTSGSASTASSSTATHSGSSSSQLKRIAELVKRAQPHTIVQTYDKILRLAQLDAQLIVNGEALLPDATGASSLQLGWQHRGGDSGVESKAKVAAGFFDPTRGRFHYALGFRYSHVDPTLSLSSISDVTVGISSSTCQQCLFIPVIPEESSCPADRPSKRLGPASSSSKPKLSIKSWRFVAETPARVGLAVYELPVRKASTTSSSFSSSIVALVWTRDRARLEVVSLFAQLHIPELLAATLSLPSSRPSLIVPRCLPASSSGGEEDSVGLRGFTMALTLRTLDRVVWEREWYQVDFPRPSKAERRGGGNPSDIRVVTVQLLDEHGAFRDRARYIDGSMALPVETEAITSTVDSTLVIDFCAWEESAIAPVWGFSRFVRASPASIQAASSTVETLGGDFTLTASGRTHELLEMRVADAAVGGNQVVVQLVKTRGNSSGGSDSDRVLVKQVDVSIGVTFLNAAFGTCY